MMILSYYSQLSTHPVSSLYGRAELPSANDTATVGPRAPGFPLYPSGHQPVEPAQSSASARVRIRACLCGLQSRIYLVIIVLLQSILATGVITVDVPNTLDMARNIRTTLSVRQTLLVLRIHLVSRTVLRELKSGRPAFPIHFPSSAFTRSRALAVWSYPCQCSTPDAPRIIVL